MTDLTFFNYQSDSVRLTLSDGSIMVPRTWLAGLQNVRETAEGYAVDIPSVAWLSYLMTLPKSHLPEIGCQVASYVDDPQLDDYSLQHHDITRRAAIYTLADKIEDAKRKCWTLHHLNKGMKRTSGYLITIGNRFQGRMYNHEEEALYICWAYTGHRDMVTIILHRLTDEGIETVRTVETNINAYSRLEDVYIDAYTREWAFTMRDPHSKSKTSFYLDFQNGTLDHDPRSQKERKIFTLPSPLLDLPLEGPEKKDLPHGWKVSKHGSSFVCSRNGQPVFVSDFKVDYVDSWKLIIHHGAGGIAYYYNHLLRDGVRKISRDELIKLDEYRLNCAHAVYFRQPEVNIINFHNTPHYLLADYYVPE